MLKKKFHSVRYFLKNCTLLFFRSNKKQAYYFNIIIFMRNPKINGTLIWYYYICKREVWLIAHQINADQDNPLLDLGRFLSEQSYEREKKEIRVGEMVFDLIKKSGGDIVIGEIKKSSRFLSSARMQLAFYLLHLENKGIKAKGKLLIPKEKMNIGVELDDQLKKELKNACEEIMVIISNETPPKAKKIIFCKKCAYAEFCWA